MLAVFPTDHLPLRLSLDLCKDENRGKELWEFTNSLSMKSGFEHDALENLENEGIADFQAKWEFLKYEIRTKSIEFSKLQAQNTKKKTFF